MIPTDFVRLVDRILPQLVEWDVRVIANAGGVNPGACKDAWDGILEAQLDYRHRPCNFVEIMPRLDEHKRRK